MESLQKNHLLFRIILVSILVVYTSQMFAPRQERILQSAKIQGSIFQVSVTQKISFQEFKSSQNKRYNSQNEELYRMLVFNQNIQKIQNHNDKAKQQLKESNSGYTMKINQFSDLTQKEFRQIYTKTYPSSEVIVEKSKLVVNGIESPCKNCRGPSNYSFISTESEAQIRSRELDVKIFEIIGQSEKLKAQESSSELDALLQKAKNDVQVFSNSSNIPSINFPEINLPNIDLSQIPTVKPSLDFDIAMPIDKSRLLQTANQTENIEVDWTTVSGTIKFQGECGSCYAFATADAVSAMNSIYKFGFNVPLSVQQIVDCSKNGLTFGCDGGFLQGSYAYIKTNGLTTNFQYKYTGKQSDCKINNGTFKISTFKTLPQGQCNTIIQQLKKKPLAIAIAAYRLRFYSTGVFDDCNNYVDHAVLLVGYKSGVGWKIKNTWGTSWGMNGYAWIKEGNNCGICQNAVSATIAEEPQSQTIIEPTNGVADNKGPNIDQKLGKRNETQPIQIKSDNKNASAIQTIPVFIEPKIPTQKSSLKGVSNLKESIQSLTELIIAQETKKLNEKISTIVVDKKDIPTKIPTAKIASTFKK